MEQKLIPLSAPTVGRRSARIAPHYKAPINEPYDLHDIPSVQSLIPRVYVVSAGDTFASISKQMYGEEGGADKIASKNGWLAHQKLTPGSVLFLPTYTPVRNKVSSALPYHEFMSIMTGSIAPYFHALVPPAQPLPYKKKPKRHWWKTLVKIIAVGIALALAPQLSVFILDAAAGMLAMPAFTGAFATFVADGVAAAITTSVAQGVAIGVGAQEKFSIGEAVETGFAYAAMSGALTDFKNAAFASREMAIAALEVGAAAVGTQLVSMAAGVSSKFDARAVAVQITAALAGAKLGQAVGTQADVLGKYGTRATNTMTTVLMNSALGNVVSHTPMNLENMAASAMGSMVVQEVGDRIEVRQGKNAAMEEEMRKTEEVIHATVPEAKLDLSRESIGQAQADFNGSKARNWSTESVKRGSWADKYNNDANLRAGMRPGKSSTTSTARAGSSSHAAVERVKQDEHLSMVDGAMAVGRGMVNGIMAMPSDAIHTVQVVNNTRDHASRLSLAVDVAYGLNETYTTFKGGDTNKQLEMIGEFAGPVLLPSVVGLVSKVGFLARIGAKAGRVTHGAERLLNPNEIRFSQQSVSYLKNRPGKEPYTLDDITHSMSTKGWQGESIDVVKMPEGGYTSLDNTRVLAARRANIDVNVNIRNYNERLPSNMLDRFEHPMVPGGFAQTWGEALEYRIIRQNSAFQNKNFPLGSYEEPTVTYPKIY